MQFTPSRAARIGVAPGPEGVARPQGTCPYVGTVDTLAENCQGPTRGAGFARFGSALGRTRIRSCTHTLARARSPRSAPRESPGARMGVVLQAVPVPRSEAELDAGVRMPEAGLEPARGCPHQLLRLACLPFHHPGRGYWSKTCCGSSRHATAAHHRSSQTPERPCCTLRPRRNPGQVQVYTRQREGSAGCDGHVLAAYIDDQHA